MLASVLLNEPGNVIVPNTNLINVPEGLCTVLQCSRAIIFESAVLHCYVTEVSSLVAGSALLGEGPARGGLEPGLRTAAWV
jgi:hypothetical protein